MSGAEKPRKARAPKPLPLLPLNTSREALALQQNIDEARALRRQRWQMEEPDDVSGAVAHRSMLAGLAGEIERLEKAIQDLGFVPDPMPEVSAGAS
jgi:hypothetical protein